uniref:Minor capsid protein P11 C-terminal conserved region domain-containing protein n=1 Tax=viral metagenome TaxID=1070528 RepID=A0A6C0JFH8_9ZZZZ|tara:strand:- start:928 stop:1524 length:597 start_codon:yes stop_codon:yes gene_type:complete
MNIAKSLKKLASNQTFVVLAGIVAVAAVYLYSQGFTTSISSMTNSNDAASAVDQDVNSAGPSDSQIQCAAGGNNFTPSQPLGQNGGHGAASGAVTDTYGLPPSCAKQQVVDPAQLLPKDSNSEFSKLNPMGSGDLKNVSLLKAGWHIGINTVGQSLRNANLQLRSEPANPQLNIGPWNQSTITSDMQRRPLEIGCGAN